jgi:predicted urease superfamily metal-dependent hydrolase
MSDDKNVLTTIRLSEWLAMQRQHKALLAACEAAAPIVDAFRADCIGAEHLRTPRDDAEVAAALLHGAITQAKANDHAV